MASIPKPGFRANEPTAAGRAIVTAANAAAQKTLLGLGTENNVVFNNINVPYNAGLTGSERYVLSAEANYSRKFGFYITANGNEGGFKADSQFNFSASAAGYVFSTGGESLAVSYTGSAIRLHFATGVPNALEFGNDLSQKLIFNSHVTGPSNVIEQRNGTTSQAHHVYNTYTSGALAEWFSIDWKTTSNVCTIGPATTGGTVRPVTAVGVWGFSGTINGRASTTAASTAPIKIATGVLMTTPEAGAIEYDGTNLYFTRSDGTRKTLAVV